MAAAREPGAGPLVRTAAPALVTVRLALRPRAAISSVR